MQDQCDCCLSQRYDVLWVEEFMMWLCGDCEYEWNEFGYCSCGDYLDDLDGY